MNTELPIEVTVRINFQDYWRATSTYMLRHFKMKWLILSAALYLVLFFISTLRIPTGDRLIHC